MESSKSPAFLPKFFKWVFTIVEVVAGIATVGLIVVMLVDPALPPTAHFGPINGVVLGQPAQFELTAAPAGGPGQGAPTFHATLFNGSVALTENDPAGLIEVLKQYGLPLAIIHALFAAALFDILRRLFRNVGRGESFSPQTVRLVQWIGGALIVFAFVSAIGEVWFHHAVFAYAIDHTQVMIGGAPVHLPPAAHHAVWSGHWLPLGRGTFWFGLLVLALAEVFRQGLALKRDSELTV